MSSGTMSVVLQLMVGLFITASGIAGLWYFDTVPESNVQLQGILAFLAGAGLMATVSAVGSRFATRPHENENSQINLAVNLLLTEAAALTEEGLPFDMNVEQRWAPSAADLVGIDNTLALAKTRIDLETELRRLATEFKIGVGRRQMALNVVAQQLQKRDALPEAFVSLIRNILSVCNQAVHGAQVDTEDTSQVVEIGARLIYHLRGVDPRRF